MMYTVLSVSQGKNDPFVFVRNELVLLCQRRLPEDFRLVLPLYVNVSEVEKRLHGESENPAFFHPLDETTLPNSLT